MRWSACLTASLVTVLLPVLTWADSAPHAFQAPAGSKEVKETAPFDTATLETYLENIGVLYTVDAFAGKNAQLKAEADADRVLLAGRGYEVQAGPEELFADGFIDGPYTVYESAVLSFDAAGVRLVLDLTALTADEEVWVIDPSGPRAHGPYTLADAHDAEKWSPLIEGDTAVLMARSLSGKVPQVRLVAVSHMFRDLKELKVLGCNQDASCETDTTLQSVASGVGMISVPQSGYDFAICTGTLVNNADTPSYEPYFITSWHCVPDVADASDVDIIWDYRTVSCGSGTLASTQRSEGEVLLTSNATYDATLMRLKSVPTGAYGRNYAGWTTNAPTIGNPVVTIHHPDGSYKRISYGTVQGLNQYSSGFQYQIKVLWHTGVTEGGSSGSPLLLGNAGYRIIGTLSNGPDHSCTNPSMNYDWYSSFAKFYPQAQGWLTGSNPPPPQGTTGNKSCAAEKVFADHPEVLDNLRTFRDEALEKTAMGRRVVDAYYFAAPALARTIDHAPRFRTVFTALALPCARIGAWLG